ncbi:hypothetical protein Egran_06203 [Elaphomyces granulatus]|uniref:Actin cytoskeleton-regulatory complex protein END3 n=1 Tax=Elaphomyces granulatus TaxID=519963 RepID=A0A232LQE4_9EURO|nr:hypothetical protein Egran_06203 [Elaphomyces granulatus]
MPETGQPINLSTEEKRVFSQLFQSADKTGLGVVTGEFAVPFFEKTKLPPETLGVIWQIADRENRGFLTPPGFTVVLRLIGHAQAGRVPTAELALHSGPLPRFDGLIDIPSSRASDAGSASPPPPPPANPIRVPPLNPDDVQKFNAVFDKSETPNGLISGMNGWGEVAKQIFERWNLPNEILGRIWNVADTKQRGQLDATEFIIAMHLLSSYRTGAIRGVPQTLPPGLYEAVARRSIRTSTGSRPGSDIIPPVPSIPKQYSGPPRTQSPLNRQPFSMSLFTQSTGPEWLISPQEKAGYDNVFTAVDVAKAGMISGDQAVAFFGNAKLAEDVLAQIWDLADIDADGQLTKDEFAVAMYLVRQQRNKKEPLPAVLPPALIPPSMRRQATGRPTQPPAPLVAQRSAAEDLFGLDAFNAPVAAAPTQVPQSTGSSSSAFQAPSSPTSGVPPRSASTTFKPFVPSSQFGQSLNPQLNNITATPSPGRSPAPPPDDLLGDNDPEESKKLTQETAELANLSNQIGLLSKEMQTVQTKRASAEHEFSQTSQQKRDFEARLAQARTMYEKELKDFKALEERLNTSRSEAKKFHQDFALIEASREDLQNQYNQISAALAADQGENSVLKEKIRRVTAEITQLKSALEKARSEARQQKGLVAINKKQLATVEAERDKFQGEIETVTREKQGAEGEAAFVTPNTSDIASPAISMASQNTNPFFRRTTTGLSDNTTLPAANQQNAFDSLFGPALAVPPTSTPPPPTSFRAQSPPVQQATEGSKTPDTSAAPTPSLSPSPSTLGFPEFPPQSRQITPSSVPLGDEAHVPPVTSSTKASPPVGQPDIPEIGTPLEPSSRNMISVPSAKGDDNPIPMNGDKWPALSPFDEPQATIPTKEVPKVANSQEESKQTFPAMPDAFPLESIGASGPTNHEVSTPVKDPTFDELFGGVTRERSQSQKAHDVEEAFAAMKPHSSGRSDKPDTENEFPPISELDNDDDSSDSEAQLAFDDNFAPSSPLRNGGHSKPDTWQLQAFPVPAAVPPTRPALEREDTPKDIPDIVKPGPGDSSNNIEPILPSSINAALPSNVLSVLETTAAEAPIGTEEPLRDVATDSVKKKPAFSDFDAAFAGLDLAPAKEVEDSSDDEPEAQANKASHDFDFSFDSPLQPSKPVAAPTNAGAVASPDFFSFESNINVSTVDASSQPLALRPGGGSTGTAQHNWDAIFAPLEGPKAPGGGSNGSLKPAESSVVPGTSKPGWALAAETGEDDFILQRLTGMGFPREESLAALEKFDYNINKAADFLTSRS